MQSFSVWTPWRTPSGHHALYRERTVALVFMAVATIYFMVTVGSTMARDPGARTVQFAANFFLVWGAAIIATHFFARSGVYIRGGRKRI